MSAQLPAESILASIPQATAPPGYTPLSGYVDWERSHALIAVSVIFCVLSLIFLLGRLYFNHINQRMKFGWDDIFAIVGWLSIMGLSALGIATEKTYITHTWDLSLADADDTFFKENFSQSVLLSTSNFFAKASILLLYLRIFSPRRTFRWIVYITFAILFAVSFGSIVATIVWCAPPIGQDWNFFVLQTCPKADVEALVQGPTYFATDVFIFIAPIREIAKLKLSGSKKRDIMIVFATGFIAVVTGLIGMVFRFIFYFSNVRNDAYDAYPIFICIIFETNVVLIVSSMPAWAAFSMQHLRGRGIFSGFRSRYLSRASNSKSAKTLHVDSTGPYDARVIDGSYTALNHSKRSSHPKSQVMRGAESGNTSSDAEKGITVRHSIELTEFQG